MAFIFHHQIPNNSLSLAVVDGIAEAALVSLREQGRNLLGIKMIILYHFSNFHQRSFPSQSGIPKDVPSHLDLEF